MLRNDLAALEKLYNLFSYLNANTRDTIKTFRGDRVHTDQYKGLSKALVMLGNGEMTPELQSLRERIAKLEELSEGYLKGQDIVQARLAGD